MKFYFTGSRLVGKYSTSRLGSNDGDDSEAKDVSDDDCKTPSTAQGHVVAAGKASTWQGTLDLRVGY